MAKYRNDLGEERWVPLITQLVPAGKEFEVDDVVARQNDFSIFTEIIAPAKIHPPAQDAQRSVWVKYVTEHFGIRSEALVDLNAADLAARYGVPEEPEPVLPGANATRGELVAYVVQESGGSVKAEDLDDLDQPQLLEYIGITPPNTDEPAKNATREAWAEYATNVLNATDADLDGLGRDALVDKYATKEG